MCQSENIYSDKQKKHFGNTMFVDSNLKVYHFLIKKYTTLRKRFGVVQFLISIYTLC